MSWLGLDIGGANLKAADGRGWAESVPFALWREPEKLAAELVTLINAAPQTDCIAVTMTGELCDCFRTKADGVRHILAAVVQAAGGREVRTYLIDGRLVCMEEAAELPQLAAASNWHVLAQFACRFLDGRTGLLLDIGSTTSDVVPLIDGRPQTQGLNDTDRLIAGELVYSGVGRTPICAVTPRLPWRDERCPVAAELFATAADAYIILGDMPERPNAASSADGRPLTKDFARERLARMVCADSSTFSMEDAEYAAVHFRSVQIAQVKEAVGRVATRMGRRPGCAVVSGAGEFLARLVLQEAIPDLAVVSLSERIGLVASQCAPAHAMAVLASEFA